MSKEKIYAFGVSGSKYETAHKDDFIASASHFPVAETDGKYYLTVGKEYKVFAEKGSDGNFTCSINFTYTDSAVIKTHAITHENADEYASDFVFSLLSAVTSGTTITIVYEIAGERYTETISGTSMVIHTDCVYVSGATKVLLYNSNAEIVATVTKDNGDYVTQAQLFAALKQKQDVLTAGDGITIVDSVISAAGGGSASSTKVVFDDGDMQWTLTVPVAVTAVDELCQWLYDNEYTYDAGNLYTLDSFADSDGGTYDNMGICVTPNADSYMICVMYEYWEQYAERDMYDAAMYMTFN